MPFFLGGVLAFVLNVPMRFLERRVLFFMDRSPRLRPGAAAGGDDAGGWRWWWGVVYVIMSHRGAGTHQHHPVGHQGPFPQALQRLDELIEPYGFSVSQVLNASFTVPSVSEVDARSPTWVNLLLKGAAFSTTVIGTVYQNVLSFFFTVMFTIYFLSSKERLRSQVKNLMRAYLKPPLGRKRRFRWRTSASARFPASSRASAWRACILGGMFFVTMTLLGMPYVLLHQRVSSR